MKNGKLLVGITSGSGIKIAGVTRAVKEFLQDEDFLLVIEACDSGINEQPVNAETYLGAENRINDFLSKQKKADIVFSIENGIFQEGEKWFDYTVIAWWSKKTQTIEFKKIKEFPAEFPTEQVEKARKIGFETTTVGSVLLEDGIVSNSKDPHFDIIGKKREDIIYEGVKGIISSGIPEISGGKKRNVGIGFFWSEGETYLKAWSEPVFGFYDENGDKKEVGLGAFSPGKVQGFEPNSNPNRKSTFLEAIDGDMDVYFHQVPENVAKMIIEYLSPQERSFLKASVDLIQKKAELEAYYKGVGGSIDLLKWIIIGYGET